MAVNKSFSLGSRYDEFIMQQVSHGRFGNATEVVRAGLRMLEDYETHMSELRASIDQADASIAAGKGNTYTDPVRLTESIIRRGRQRSKSAS